MNEATHESRPRTVVWDMGGIFHVYFTERVLMRGEREGWPLEEVPLGPTGRVADPAYDRMDAGEVSEGDYYHEVIRRLADIGVDHDPRSEDPGAPEALRPQVWQLIEEIAASPLRQAVLTNDASAWLGERWWEGWEHAHHFDALVDVATLGVRKPDPATYRHVLSVLDAEPADAVFIDDMHVNCAGAEAVGMHSVWFDITDPAGSVRRLRELISMPVPTETTETTEAALPGATR